MEPLEVEDHDHPDTPVLPEREVGDEQRYGRPTRRRRIERSMGLEVRGVGGPGQLVHRGMMPRRSKRGRIA